MRNASFVLFLLIVVIIKSETPINTSDRSKNEIVQDIKKRLVVSDSDKLGFDFTSNDKNIPATSVDLSTITGKEILFNDGKRSSIFDVIGILAAQAIVSKILKEPLEIKKVSTTLISKGYLNDSASNFRKEQISTKNYKVFLNFTTNGINKTTAMARTEITSDGGAKFARKSDLSTPGFDLRYGSGGSSTIRKENQKTRVAINKRPTYVKIGRFSSTVPKSDWVQRGCIKTGPFSIKNNQLLPDSEVVDVEVRTKERRKARRYDLPILHDTIHLREADDPKPLNSPKIRSGDTKKIVKKPAIVAKLGQYPSQISLQVQYRYGKVHVCGAVIIREKIFLTAAECISGLTDEERANQLYVLAGCVTVDSKSCQLHHVMNIHMHEDFDKKSLDHDIAIGRVEIPFKWTVHVNLLKPVKKKTTKLTSFDDCIKTSWGVFPDGPQSIALYHIKAEMVEDSFCSKLKWPKYEMRRMFCGMVSMVYDKGSICDASTGGALICEAQLYGLSRAPSRCGKEAICVFTDLSHYNGWIDGMIGKILDSSGIRSGNGTVNGSKRVRHSFLPNITILTLVYCKNLSIL